MVKTNATLWKSFRRARPQAGAPAGFGWLAAHGSREDQARLVQGAASHSGNPNHGAALQGSGAAGENQSRGSLPLGHGRGYHAPAAGWTEANSPEAGRAQGSGLSSSRRTVPGMDHGWILAGIVAAAAASAEKPSEPLHPGVAAAGISLFVGVPTIIAFLVAPKMGGIYNVPARSPRSVKHRNKAIQAAIRQNGACGDGGNGRLRRYRGRGQIEPGPTPAASPASSASEGASDPFARTDCAGTAG